MTPADWIVAAGAAAAILLVNWYFFASGRAVTAGSAGAESQEVTVTVHGGYEPATIRVQSGRPVRLRFDRQETSSCSEEVVFPDFGVRRFLPAHQETVIEVTPPAPGTYQFACGMGMLHGRLIAE